MEGHGTGPQTVRMELPVEDIKYDLRGASEDLISSQVPSAPVVHSFQHIPLRPENHPVTYAPKTPLVISSSIVKSHPALNIYGFRAYLDDRENCFRIRIFVMVPRDMAALIEHRLMCQIFNETMMIHQDKVTRDEIWNDNTPYHNALITCSLCNTSADPRTAKRLQLCDHNCTVIVAHLKVISSNFRNRTHHVGVCAKVIYGSPNPIRLIEWVELNRALGAHKIYLYNTSLRGPAKNVITYYEKQGFIQLNHHNFPEKMSRIIYNTSFPTPHYQQNWVLEVFSMNDCLYTSSERMIANFDLDEMITPVHHHHLENLSDHLLNKYPNSASFRFSTGVFSDEIPVDKNRYPNYMHMINHNKRTRIDPESPKSLVHSERCVAMAHHVCKVPIRGTMWIQDVPENVGYLRHYREHCRLTGERFKCAKLLKYPKLDNTLEKYAGRLNATMLPVLLELNLITH